MANRCTSCDRELDEGATLCPACGNDLSGDDEIITDPTDIDMRQILDPSASSAPIAPARSGLAKTIAFPPPAASLDETRIEGFEPVKLKHRRRIVSAESHRRHFIGRVLPLLAVVAVGLLALGLAAFDLMERPSSSASSDSSRHQLVELDAGTFTIGLTGENKESVLQACFRLSNNPNHECRRSYLEGLGEFPSRQVQLGAFQIDQFEVTNSRYERCVDDDECPPRSVSSCRFFTHRGYQLDARVPQRMLDAELPAVCVTLDEAEAYCRFAGGRLPTPDEWERAARGNDHRLSPWGELWAPNLMNWAETDMGGFPVVGRLDGYDLTAPVSNFEHGASPDDILNLFGNVAEWVAPSEGRPDGTRGGSYRDDLREFRITRQIPQAPASRRSDTGFRCVYPGDD